MAMAGRCSVYTGFKHDVRGKFVFYWQNPSFVNGTVCLILRMVLNQWPNNNKQTQAIDTRRQSFHSLAQQWAPCILVWLLQMKYKLLSRRIEDRLKYVDGSYHLLDHVSCWDEHAEHAHQRSILVWKRRYISLEWGCLGQIANLFVGIFNQPLFRYQSELIVDIRRILSNCQGCAEWFSVAWGCRVHLASRVVGLSAKLSPLFGQGICVYIVYLTCFKSFNVIFELSLSLQFLSNINENDEDSEQIAESRWLFRKIRGHQRRAKRSWKVFSPWHSCWTRWAWRRRAWSLVPPPDCRVEWRCMCQMQAPKSLKSTTCFIFWRYFSGLGVGYEYIIHLSWQPQMHKIPSPKCLAALLSRRMAWRWQNSISSCPWKQPLIGRLGDVDEWSETCSHSDIVYIYIYVYIVIYMDIYIYNIV